MKNLLNVSNHNLGLNQLQELQEKGFDVIELSDELKKAWGQLTPENYMTICSNVVDYAEENNCKALHVAGFAPAVVALCADIKPEYPVFYAYSCRVAVEIVQDDGSVLKDSKFTHQGFYEYPRVKR